MVLRSPVAIRVIIIKVTIVIIIRARGGVEIGVVRVIIRPLTAIKHARVLRAVRGLSIIRIIGGSQGGVCVVFQPGVGRHEPSARVESSLHRQDRQTDRQTATRRPHPSILCYSRHSIPHSTQSSQPEKSQGEEGL